MGKIDCMVIDDGGVSIRKYQELLLLQPEFGSILEEAKFLNSAGFFKEAGVGKDLSH
jgi:hypothetical protein